jgi:hypothetical protein
MVNFLYLGACEDSNPKTCDYELSALQLCYRGTINVNWTYIFSIWVSMRIQTLNLVIISQEFYHCATGAQLM